MRVRKNNECERAALRRGEKSYRFFARASASCCTTKSTYAATRAFPVSVSLRKFSSSSVSAVGNVTPVTFCKCGSSVSLNISSTDTPKYRESRNNVDAVASLRPFSNFAIADWLSPVALANCCCLKFFFFA